jgi:hypothetical protein
MSGSDISAHKNEPIVASNEVRHWLAQNLGNTAIGPAAIWGRFNDFVADNYDALTARGYSPKDIEEQKIGELIGCMKDWLAANPNP